MTRPASPQETTMKKQIRVVKPGTIKKVMADCVFVVD
jgi:hypothetical protein